jgi:hypothetical protein
MRPRLSRLRRPEWGIGVESVSLLVILFGAPWFSGLRRGWWSYPPLHPHVPQNTGWQSLPLLGPLAVVVAALGLAIWWLQATRRSPALPAVAVVIDAVLSFALSAGLVIRVLIAHPAHSVGVRYGAYAGLVLALSLFAGCYRSLRVDGIAPEDGPQEIETITLDGGAAA